MTLVTSLCWECKKPRSPWTCSGFFCSGCESSRLSCGLLWVVTCSYPRLLSGEASTRKDARICQEPAPPSPTSLRGGGDHSGPQNYTSVPLSFCGRRFACRCVASMPRLGQEMGGWGFRPAGCWKSPKNSQRAWGQSPTSQKHTENKLHAQQHKKLFKPQRGSQPKGWFGKLKASMPGSGDANPKGLETHYLKPVSDRHWLSDGGTAASPENRKDGPYSAQSEREAS